VFAALLFLNIPEQLNKPHWLEVLKHPMKEFDLIGFALFGPAAIMLFLVQKSSVCSAEPAPCSPFGAFGTIERALLP
jgi:hypothetical protein